MGFVRVKINGQIHELSEQMQIQVEHPNAIDLIVDRLVLRPGIERRGRFPRSCVPFRSSDHQRKLPRRKVQRQPKNWFSLSGSRIRCGLSLPEVTPRLFSFNSPHGHVQRARVWASHPPMPRREGGG